MPRVAYIVSALPSPSNSAGKKAEPRLSRTAYPGASEEKCNGAWLYIAVVNTGTGSPLGDATALSINHLVVRSPLTSHHRRRCLQDGLDDLSHARGSTPIQHHTHFHRMPKRGRRHVRRPQVRGAAVTKHRFCMKGFPSSIQTRNRVVEDPYTLRLQPRRDGVESNRVVTPVVVFQVPEN
jgi:hypothetical protein